MSDLARQAMEKIAEIVGDRFEDADVEVLRAGINSVGTLVSHERLDELNAYEAELQAVRNILQNVHPMGAAKHIGLRESATALAEVVEKQVVSHEDAAWLKLARCPDPLTLDAAVQVMGREPDEHDILQHEGHELWGWTPERIRVRRWLESETFDVLCGFTKYDNPTIGLFALLVAAAKMGEKA